MPSIVLFVVVHVNSHELLILWFSMVLWILSSRFLCLLSLSVELAITLPRAFVAPAYLPGYPLSLPAPWYSPGHMVARPF